MPSYDDLIEQIELPQCQCLNAASEHTLRHCLEAEQREEAGTYLESDADEELLITLKFMQAVRISGLIVSTASGSADSAPKNLKLFVNKVGLDFDSARSDKCVQEVELTKAEAVGGARVELRFVNFQGVQELGIFVGSNQLSGVVRLERLRFEACQSFCPVSDGKHSVALLTQLS